MWLKQQVKLLVWLFLFLYWARFLCLGMRLRVVTIRTCFSYVKKKNKTVHKPYKQHLLGLKQPRIKIPSSRGKYKKTFLELQLFTETSITLSQDPCNQSKHFWDSQTLHFIQGWIWPLILSWVYFKPLHLTSFRPEALPSPEIPFLCSHPDNWAAEFPISIQSPGRLYSCCICFFPFLISQNPVFSSRCLPNSMTSDQIPWTPLAWGSSHTIYY